MHATCSTCVYKLALQFVLKLKKHKTYHEDPFHRMLSWSLEKNKQTKYNLARCGRIETLEHLELWHVGTKFVGQGNSGSRDRQRRAEWPLSGNEWDKRTASHCFIQNTACCVVVVVGSRRTKVVMVDCLSVSREFECATIEPKICKAGKADCRF